MKFFFHSFSPLCGREDEVSESGTGSTATAHTTSEAATAEASASEEISSTKNDRTAASASPVILIV